MDKFRSDFFDKIIKEENDKENELKILQRKCFHNYIVDIVYQNGYEQRTCSKCGHSSLKNAKVWNTGTCIIA